MQPAGRPSLAIAKRRTPPDWWVGHAVHGPLLLSVRWLEYILEGIAGVGATEWNGCAGDGEIQWMGRGMRCSRRMTVCDSYI